MKETKESSKKLLNTINKLQVLENENIEDSEELFTGSRKSLYKDKQKKIDPIHQWIIESITKEPWSKSVY